MKNHTLVKSQLDQNKTGWMKSFLDGFSQDENGDPIPWMSYPAIEFLEKNLTQNHEIFEFGAGASTLFFAKKVKSVTTLETNKRWFNYVKDLLKEEKKVQLFLMEDGLKNPQYEAFPQQLNKKFDFIIIDSLKRFECVKNSINALKPDGKLILDDSERKNYKKIFDFLQQENFLKQDFIGIAPGQLRLKNTTIFWHIPK